MDSLGSLSCTSSRGFVHFGPASCPLAETGEATLSHDEWLSNHPAMGSAMPQSRVRDLEAAPWRSWGRREVCPVARFCLPRNGGRVVDGLMNAKIGPAGNSVSNKDCYADVTSLWNALSSISLAPILVGARHSSVRISPSCNSSGSLSCPSRCKKVMPRSRLTGLPFSTWTRGRRGARAFPPNPQRPQAKRVGLPTGLPVGCRLGCAPRLRCGSTGIG